MSSKTNLVPPLYQRVAGWLTKATAAAADKILLFDSAANGFGKTITVAELIATGSAVAPSSAVASAAATLTAAQANTAIIVTNAGASGTITYVLPPALPGMEVRALVKAAFELRLDPSGTQTIALPSTGVQGAAGKYLTADAVGESVHLICTVAGTWDSFGAVDGTWTAEA